MWGRAGQGMGARPEELLAGPRASAQSARSAELVP